jgi:uroporphyrinogen decarboxylase
VALPWFSSLILALAVRPARQGSSPSSVQRGASGAGATGVIIGATLLDYPHGVTTTATAPRLVRAARREPTDRTPVWFMRQAGRSLPEYREIRSRHGFFAVAHTPELCAEVTLQPVRRHDVDAAVMFADIMTPVLGMGIRVELVEGVGPVVEHPIRTRADVEALRVPDPEEAFAPVLEAVRLVRAELADDKAVIGFCGGPFTVAGYLVEGRPSRELSRTKAMMLGEPELWDALMDKLSATFAPYVAAKVAAGADVIQLFDSWVGTLSPSLYRERVAPWSARILDGLDVPTIHFGTGATHLLEEIAAAGGDVIGLDWRVGLDDGWAKVPGHAVQGNLDPAALLAPWEVVEREARDVLGRAAGRPGHIFNLGHGVLPETDPDTLTRLVSLVREVGGG